MYRVQCTICTLAYFWLRKTSLIEENAKCRRLKKLICKRDFAAGVYLSEAQSPIPPPLHTVYVYTVDLSKQGMGEGGRVEPERRLEGK
jgi:hypothetical protein